MDLSSFKPIKLVSGKNTMTVSKTGVGLSQAAVMQLGRPEYVKILISYDEKSIAIKTTSNDDPDKTKFLNKNKKSPVVRWNNSTIKDAISGMMNWNLDKHIYKIEGKFYPQDMLIIFDLKKAQITA